MDDNRNQQEKILTPGDAANNNTDGLEGTPIETDGLEGTPIESQQENRPADDRLTALEAELADQKDRLLRALAETENVRRRAQREREDASRYGAANFAKDLLNVADNLRRALTSVPEAQVTDELTRTLLQGVDATEREL